MSLFLSADKAEKLLAEAAALGSQLIVFPEAFIGGYPRGLNFADRTAKGKESFRKYHAAAIDVPGEIFSPLFGFFDRFFVRRNDRTGSWVTMLLLSEHLLGLKVLVCLAALHPFLTRIYIHGLGTRPLSAPPNAKDSTLESHSLTMAP